MEIIRDYSEILETMSYIPHPIEAVLERLVKKGIVSEVASRNFIQELK
jgi:predicted transcriptional regulator